MTNADIDRIEVALGRTLPPDYKALLANHTATLAQAASTLRYFAVPWTEADDIIRGNLAARSHADSMTIADDDDLEKPWPEEYLVVGTNGGGDFWSIDLAASMRACGSGSMRHTRSTRSIRTWMTT
jgi:cell wall assembly regulator SMI1